MTITTTHLQSPRGPQIDITLNVIDVQRILSQVLGEYFHGAEIGTITIESWNQKLIVMTPEKLLHPIRHDLHESHATIK